MIWEYLIKFHRKFKFYDEEMNEDKLDFRINTLQREEYEELVQAFEDGNKEEIVDALVDTAWIAIGTLDLLGVDVDEAFGEVSRANMSKSRGVKKGRENSGGFDVIKPRGWEAPNHSKNYGVLDEIF